MEGEAEIAEKAFLGLVKKWRRIHLSMNRGDSKLYIYSSFDKSVLLHSFDLLKDSIYHLSGSNEDDDDSANDQPKVIRISSNGNKNTTIKPKAKLLLLLFNKTISPKSNEFLFL